MKSDSSNNYNQLFLLLGFIILFSEMLIMLVFSIFDLSAIVPRYAIFVIDDGLLFLLSYYPIYKYIYTPIVNNHNRNKEKSDLLSEALKGSGDSVMITDIDGKIIYINDTFTDVTGYSSKEVLGKNPSIIKSGKQDKNFYKKMWSDLLKNGRWKGEVWNRRKNGDIFPEELIIRSILDKNGKVNFFVGTFIDITEKKNLERVLLQSQKIEAIGTLVSGVAHNFNNLLAAIMGKAYLSKKSKDISRKNILLTDIEGLSRDSASLIRQLLTFSRETSHNKVTFNLKETLKSSVETAKLGIINDVKLNINLEDGMHSYGDIVNIKQVIINIVNNARDAVSSNVKTGIIEISLSKEVKRGLFKAKGLKSLTESVAKISIKDNGSGIPKEHLDRVFDPFFTTKKGELGTGLGLSTAIGIIKDHGGDIEAFSKEGEYTELVLILPLVDGSHLNDEKISRSSV